MGSRERKRKKQMRKKKSISRVQMRKLTGRSVEERQRLRAVDLSQTKQASGSFSLYVHSAKGLRLTIALAARQIQ